MEKTLPISAIVVCFNEEENIKACLESLRFCDEIIVVDSFSTDSTPSIAKEMGVKFISRKWSGYRDQKEFALSQTSYDWVINLDADERASEELKDNILRVLKDKKLREGIAGFEISRVVYYLNRWWRRGGWYPEYRLRFFNKNKITWGGMEPHEKVIPSGVVKRIDGEIYHYTYKNMTSQLNQLTKFASISSRENFLAGNNFSLYKLLVSPFIRFFRFYILKQGFREGIAGFIVAIFEGYYTFSKYALLWEEHFNSLKKRNEK